MSPRTCPDCGEVVTYRSCQQPNTEAIAELALAVHRLAHGAPGLNVDVVGRAFFQATEHRHGGAP